MEVCGGQGKKKLRGDERRASIISAVRKVFAEKGFRGTTTRELAAAAGVSEALLFRHFPNKQELYAAMMHAHCNAQDFAHIDRYFYFGPESSTLKLVRLVDIFYTTILNWDQRDGETSIHGRLMIRSLCEDGEFVRIFFQGVPAELNRALEESYKAAVAAGDAHPGPFPPVLGGWLVQVLATSLKMFMLPASQVIDYGLPHEDVVRYAVWFALRGMGIKEEVIVRLYGNQETIPAATGNSALDRNETTEKQQRNETMQRSDFHARIES